MSAGTNCHSVACVESIMCGNRLLGKSVTMKLRTSKGEVYEEFVCAHTVTASAGSGRHRTTVSPHLFPVQWYSPEEEL